ncbi:hypothetical protein AB840_04840 [Megasphaera cerevisiae DSM 20462]|jgi:hypothetical protein|uniref:Uncharacterized protein n=1 Tax=Megasphaera cerevisiae DSM 20462 TaxID=1122219 RepID=A0A0J6WWW4_9FIRM|nr:hypothetical protein [Megasphaera cerevisiae]KMO87089.1 hypothetical protein AB840_04840 [Megasphaera cerevisiae DSM 20462]SJZ78553.1 hypothetical protein SAMN05660900_01453 [Megasphaera cerevisiae DSM 20462]
MTQTEFLTLFDCKHAFSQDELKEVVLGQSELELVAQKESRRFTYDIGVATVVRAMAAFRLCRYFRIRWIKHIEGNYRKAFFVQPQELKGKEVTLKIWKNMKTDTSDNE